MTWSVTLHVACDEDAPTMAQLDAIADAMSALSRDPAFENTEGAYLETGAPLDLDPSRIVKAN